MHFRKMHFRKTHFRKMHFRKMHFRKMHFQVDAPRPRDNATALYEAAARGAERLAALLLRARAEPARAARSGWAPLAVTLAVRTLQKCLILAESSNNWQIDCKFLAGSFSAVSKQNGASKQF